MFPARAKVEKRRNMVSSTCYIPLSESCDAELDDVSPADVGSVGSASRSDLHDGRVGISTDARVPPGRVVSQATRPSGGFSLSVTGKASLAGASALFSCWASSTAVDAPLSRVRRLRRVLCCEAEAVRAPVEGSTGSLTGTLGTSIVHSIAFLSQRYSIKGTSTFSGQKM